MEPLDSQAVRNRSDIARDEVQRVAPVGPGSRTRAVAALIERVAVVPGGYHDHIQELSGLGGTAGIGRDGHRDRENDRGDCSQRCSRQVSIFESASIASGRIIDTWYRSSNLSVSLWR